MGIYERPIGIVTLRKSFHGGAPACVASSTVARARAASPWNTSLLVHQPRPEPLIDISPAELWRWWWSRLSTDIQKKAGAKTHAPRARKLRALVLALQLAWCLQRGACSVVPASWWLVLSTAGIAVSTLLSPWARP